MNDSVLQRLFWAGASATAVLGAAIALTTGAESPDPLLAGLFGLCLGLTVIFMTGRAVATGEVRLRTRHARRDERPGAFWTAVAMYGLTGAAIATAALWHLLGS